jgi:hypothetical protein
MMMRNLPCVALACAAVLSITACAPGSTRSAYPPTGYADTVRSVPGFLPAAGALAPIGRGAAEERRLPGRGREFMRGVEHVSGSLPVRGSVWWGDAAPLAAEADSVVFATAWVPVARLGDGISCVVSSGATTTPAVRLAAVVRDANGDLEMETWIEATGVGGCEGNAELRERLRGFADDAEMFARRVARLGVPVRRR